VAPRATKEALAKAIVDSYRYPFNSSLSDKLKRCFLGARRTVSWDKGQIEPETLEMIKCLKD
jgi:hypothetical protein